MKYQILNQEKAVFNFSLKGKKLTFQLDYVPQINSVTKEKIKVNVNNSVAVLKMNQLLDVFFEELGLHIAFLESSEIIDISAITNALYCKCILHIYTFNRLIDSDLTSFATTAILILNSWLNNKVLEHQCEEIRKMLIRKILDELGNKVFITRYAMNGQSYELIPYDKVTNNNSYALKL